MSTEPSVEQLVKEVGGLTYVCGSKKGNTGSTYRIYGVGVSEGFEKQLTEKEFDAICLDVWNNPEKYYKSNIKGISCQKFLKGLIIDRPGKAKKWLESYVLAE
jgi:hypothetical protein